MLALFAAVLWLLVRPSVSNECIEAGGKWNEAEQSCSLRGIRASHCADRGGSIVAERSICANSRITFVQCVAFGGQWDERRDLCTEIALRP